MQRYSDNIDPSGPLTRSTEISPRLNGKFTIQPSPTNTFIIGVQYDQYNVEGRTGYPGTQSADNQTVTEDAPEWVWNVQWRKVFGTSTFVEAKFTGLDRKSRVVSLSIKAKEAHEEAEAMVSYRSSDASSGTTLGDLLKERIAGGNEG